MTMRLLLIAGVAAAGAVIATVGVFVSLAALGLAEDAAHEQDWWL